MLSEEQQGRTGGQTAVLRQVRLLKEHCSPLLAAAAAAALPCSLLRRCCCASWRCAGARTSCHSGSLTGPASSCIRSLLLQNNTPVRRLLPLCTASLTCQTHTACESMQPMHCHSAMMTGITPKNSLQQWAIRAKPECLMCESSARARLRSRQPDQNRRWSAGCPACASDLCAFSQTLRCLQMMDWESESAAKFHSWPRLSMHESSDRNAMPSCV